MLAHLDAAYRFARWLCRDPADAEDVVHDAVVRAWRAWESARVADPRSWLLAIVRNCHLSALKARRPELAVREDSSDVLERIPSTLPTPEEDSQRREGQETFDALLGALPPPHREILVLRELEDMSYGEIATVVGIPLGTVMSRLARARAALRELWERSPQGVSHELS